MLDNDGGGGVSIEEFCENVIRAVTSETPVELDRLLKLVKKSNSDEKALKAELVEVKNDIKVIGRQMERMEKMLAECCIRVSSSSS